MRRLSIVRPQAISLGPVRAATLRGILYSVFLLSGMTGLIYEAAWTRYLQLFLGHAAYAQVLVLSLFMGGMAAGALLASRLSHRRLSPLIAYAVIEAALGIAALAFHPLFDALTRYAYASLLPGTQGSGQAMALQWLLAAFLILPQSVLLGMTFPLMSAGVLRLGSQQGGRVFAMLYFTNSAGAVFGVLLAGFWLVEYYGLQMTMMAAGAGNLVVAAIALSVALRRAGAAPAAIPPGRGKRIGGWLLTFAFLTAAASFLYEIAWLRMLALVQGASTHAFETMLSAFILGLALGGLWIRGRIERYQNPLTALALIQILMGLAALATLPAYHFTFDIMQWALGWLPRTDAGYLGYSVIGYLISALIMVPASFFAGMTLPLLTYILYLQGRGEREIGRVYGWNTLGGIAGTALGALLLMPMIGLKNVLLVGAAVDIALGISLAVFLFRRKTLNTPRLAAILATLSLIALPAALLGFRFDLTRTASGVFRYGQAHIDPDAEVVHHADGRTATVNLIKYQDGRMSITTNGKPDAAINMRRARGERAFPPGSDEYTMTLLGALPLAHMPDARTAAVIGHGSGLTSHVVLASPHIKHLDVIEIEPEMIRAARAFLPRVARAYDDSRAHYFIEDARAFFARSSRRYDVIISEPSNPWVSGVASLYTPEFYRQVKSALTPGGIFVQWFHLYEIDRPLVSAIMQSIASEFADYLLYTGNDTDLVLIATASQNVPPFSATLFSWPEMRAELNYLGIRSRQQLPMFRVASRRAYAPLLETGPANSDYFPILEFGAARSRFLDTRDDMLTNIVRDPVPMLEILSGFKPPRLPENSPLIAGAYSRFFEISRANRFAIVLDKGIPPAPEEPLSLEDHRNLRRVLDLEANRTADEWRLWFRSLFAVSKPMIPNGGGADLAAFIHSDRVAAALHDAPRDVREKLAFLLHVGDREMQRIRVEGARLLAGPLQTEDPAFHAYTLVATATACLTGTADASCRAVLAELDGVQRQSLLFDLLRAHRHSWEGAAAGR